MKRTISIIITVALLAAAVLVFNPFGKEPMVYAEQYRSGFSLVPVDYDSTGVKTDSSYLLKSQNDVSLKYVEENLTIEGMGKPVIEERGKNTFLITPPAELEQNRLYTFRLDREGKPVTWTFQTTLDFTVLGSLPGDMSTNVPVETGIEIYFTHSEILNPERYFEINPRVKGSFEQHGRAVVFVPDKELDYATLYTVTVKKGLKLIGSDQRLEQDYTFAFETAPEVEKDSRKYTALFYNKTLYDFSPSEQPLLPFYLYMRDSNLSEIDINTSIYAYSDIDGFLEAIEKSEEVPNWAYNSRQKNFIEVKGLQMVREFTQKVPVAYSDERFIEIPGTLDEGYYLVDSTWEDVRFQTFVQVTDLAIYIADSISNTIVWVNSLESGGPVFGAVIEHVGAGKKNSTNKDGVALFDSFPAGNPGEGYVPNYYFKVSAPDGRNAVLPCYQYDAGYYNNSSPDFYWRYFQTDRGLYKPDDTVEYWGFIKSRYTDEDIDEVTLEIEQGGWYFPGAQYMSFFMPFVGKPYVSEKIRVDKGFYEGNFELPGLEPGNYRITVKYRGEVINNYYITVDNYVKPAYRIDITSDKKAIFEGETVNFSIKTSFFEGTPVSNLDVDCNARGLDTQIKKTLQTDINGVAEISLTPRAYERMQGIRNAYLYCSASLPESAQISGNLGVRVFINNIDVSFETKYENGVTSLTALVNEIVLDRINSGTAENDRDYLGDPVEGKKLSGQVIRNTYVKTETGKYYDFINKVVRTRYSYDIKKEVVQSFEMTSGPDGRAVYNLSLPDDIDGYYTAKVECADNSGKPMEFDVYLTTRSYTAWYENDYYHLDADRDEYGLGDELTLTYMDGEEVLPPGRYLYIDSQCGIRGYEVSTDSRYKSIFEPGDIPNFYVTAVWFNGKTYVSERCNVFYDCNERNLVITAETDKESYKPGDDCTINIKAEDLDGNPVAATVNLAVVDEALLKLREQYVDVLESLYSGLTSGITYEYSTHLNQGEDGIIFRGSWGIMGANREMAMDATATASIVKSAVLAEMDVAFSEAMDNAYVRQEFKDTAFFRTITLDENGTGKVTLKLPDNVTSWRVTMAGLTTGLHGGTGKAELNVSLPFFINHSINSTYLAGDYPYVGVTAYGDALEEGDTVTYQLTCPQRPGLETTIRGKAFERVTIPLWQMEEGSYDIVVKALSETGDTDGFMQTIQVVSTYHEIEKAVYGDLKAGMRIPAGSGGMTTLLFSDRGRGGFLPMLYSLAYGSGNRIDQKFAAKKARDMITAYYEEAKAWYEETEVNLADYRNSDGGFGILPYAESDLRTTALVTPLVAEEIGSGELRKYYYGILFNGKENVKPAALYGMAVLGEPVLLELDKAAAVENMEIEDYIFIALAYAELGEYPPAEKIFVERVLPLLEQTDPYVR